MPDKATTPAEFEHDPRAAEADIPAGAWKIGAFRACEHGEGINYNAMLEAHGPAYVKSLVASLLDRKAITQSNADGPDSYAVLDVLDKSRDLLNDFDIPDQATFEHLRAALELRVASTDCDMCEPITWERQGHDRPEHTA